MKYKNTLQRWDEYFIEDWETNFGIEQTEFFVLVFLLNLPQEIEKNIIDNKYSIYDIGCALGQGTKMLKDYFLTSEVEGGDFSKNAVEKAKATYPNIKFKLDDLTNLQTKPVDIMFCSNVLEHFKNPWNILEGIFEKTNQYIFIMVPYQEFELCDDHEYTFDKDSFSKKKNGFHKIYEKIIDCSKFTKTYWNGKQLMVIYSKNNYKIQNTIYNNYFLNKIYSMSQSISVFKENEIINDLKIKIQSINKNNFELEQKNEELSQLIKEKDNLIYRIYNSSSWKISQPFRIIKNNINKFKRK